MTQTRILPLDQAATPIAASPGQEVVLKGVFVSKHDGSMIDAATTTWPKDAPGGASVDSGGLVDWEAGGLHMNSRDPVTHEVHAIVTGDAAPACSAAGVSAPCLVLRTLPQARSRLITSREWVDSLNGRISIEVPEPALVAVAPSTVPYLQGAAVLLGVALLGALAWTVHRRRARSAAGQLLALADRVRTKLKAADPVLAATLTPAVESAAQAVRKRRVAPESREAQRVAEALRRVEQRIEAASAAEEQQAADELLQEVESALEAADEMVPAPRRM
ncbi:MYXO-CTERM sorting domain-containing protein [Chondromyces apiculatus]|uniref:Uncharacterized protein n=1 Tax=Chondromyces apiculatus DSM 436 TaxID=1192034 RepID=A0A017SZ91_9BACT|nr:MYXO-CTERM sorting domain-containing protein [Chondromyces apiculatus]EYF02319.1 Hypothetical protein CAP_7248 [Chondromyces apiculatus DSM 436]